MLLLFMQVLDWLNSTDSKGKTCIILFIQDHSNLLIADAQNGDLNTGDNSQDIC